MSIKSKDLLLSKFSHSEHELNEEKIPFTLSMEKLINEQPKTINTPKTKYNSSIMYRTIRLLGVGISHYITLIQQKIGRLIEIKLKAFESKLSSAEINFSEKLSLHSDLSRKIESEIKSGPKIKKLIDGLTQNIEEVKEGKSARIQLNISGDDEVITSRFFQKESEAFSLIFLCMKKSKLEQNVVYIDFNLNENEQFFKTQISFELNEESLRWSKIFMGNISNDFMPILRSDLKEVKFELVSDLHQEKDFFNISFSHEKNNFVNVQKMNVSRFSKENGLGI